MVLWNVLHSVIIRSPMIIEKSSRDDHWTRKRRAISKIKIDTDRSRLDSLVTKWAKWKVKESFRNFKIWKHFDAHSPLNFVQMQSSIGSRTFSITEFIPMASAVGILKWKEILIKYWAMIVVLFTDLEWNLLVDQEFQSAAIL